MRKPLKDIKEIEKLGFIPRAITNDKWAKLYRVANGMCNQPIYKSEAKKASVTSYEKMDC